MDIKVLIDLIIIIISLEFHQEHIQAKAQKFLHNHQNRSSYYNGKAKDEEKEERSMTVASP